MTREEAIGNLIYAIRWNDMPKKEALNMAIKALEQEPCEDSISRKVVRDTIFAECSGAKLDIDFAKVLLLQRAIKSLPSVTPQPKTGHWILRDDINGQYQCDKCGMFSGLSKFDVEEEGWELSNFCSNCGTKMVEPQEREEV